jgi:primosomal protein N'
MYVVDILPLAKGVRADSLSYLSKEQAAKGSIVKAPMRNRKIRGVVSRCRAAADIKQELKNMPYEMKQIDEIENQIFFGQFIAACHSFAEFSGVTAGSIIRAITPQPIIDHNEELPKITSDIFLPNITAPRPKIIQATEKKQHGYISSLIQTSIKNGESVFVCTPTNYQAEQMESVVDTAATVIRIDGTLTKNTLLSRWREIATSQKPIVIIGTAAFLSVPRADLGLIVIMDEINTAYKMIRRPHVDKRRFARHVAESYKRDCIITGSVLPTETIWEYRNDILSSAYKPTFHYGKIPDGMLVDMKDITASGTSGVKVFSPEAAKQIRKAVSGKKVLIFVARRGRRPFTVCNDCGETVSCNRCGYPLVLINDKNKDRTFICNTCGTTETSVRRCKNCQSWRLEALGVGIDFVADILSENIPELTIFQVDGSSTSTEKKLRKVLQDFDAADSGALLTTQLGVNRLTSTVDASIVVTADSLLALPDLSIPEKLFSLLLRIRENTRDKFIIQSRSKHTDIFTHALNGDVKGFYRDQIAQREKFRYPPFSYLIKLTASGKEKTVKKHMKLVKKMFSDQKISIYPSSKNNTYEAHALIQIERDNWVNEGVLQKLRELPLAIDIDAHPESLL